MYVKVIPPLLFNVYPEHLFKAAPHNVENVIIINREKTNNLRYADDTVLIDDHPRGVQKIFDRINIQIFY